MPDPSPTLTLFQALAWLREHNYQPVILGDFVYEVDGPQGSPQEMWYPVAYHRLSDWETFPRGETHEPITKETQWL